MKCGRLWIAVEVDDATDLVALAEHVAELLGNDDSLSAEGVEVITDWGADDA